MSLRTLLISRHADELRRVERGYGNAQKPEDYLDSFGAYLRENINKIPALIVVTTSPRELTRAKLQTAMEEMEALTALLSGEEGEDEAALLE